MFLDLLTQKELSKVEKIGVHKKFKKDETIIKEGESGTSFCLILSGQIEVRKSMRGGQYKALVELGPCDLFGELGFFGVDCRSATIVAVSDCAILEFRRDDFEKFVEDRPAIGSKVYRRMAEILAERLTSNDEVLMDTIIWGLGRSRNKGEEPQISIAHLPKVTLKNI